MIHAPAYDLQIQPLHVRSKQFLFGCLIPSVVNRGVFELHDRAVEGSQSCFCSPVEMSGDDVNVAISSVAKQSIILPIRSLLLTSHGRNEFLLVYVRWFALEVSSYVAPFLSSVLLVRRELRVGTVG